MNKQDILRLLADFLHEGERMYILPQMVEDLSGILLHEVRGSEEQAFRKLVQILTQVDELGIKVSQVDGHEVLKNAEGMISLHMEGKSFNVRILAKPVGTKICLLLAFNEKAGKGRTGYKRNIETAQQRLKEIVENGFE